MPWSPADPGGWLQRVDTFGGTESPQLDMVPTCDRASTKPKAKYQTQNHPSLIYFTLNSCLQTKIYHQLYFVHLQALSFESVDKS